jgi:hypothetical protein
MQNIHRSPYRRPFTDENMTKKLPNNTGDCRVKRMPITGARLSTGFERVPEIA